MTASDAAAQIAALERAAVEARQAGHLDEARRAWERVLAIEPEHGPALAQAGEMAFAQGDLARARSALRRAAELSGREPQLWLNVALVCRRQNDLRGEEEALYRALVVDPSDLMALLMRARLFERQGRTQEAMAAYGAAATVAPPIEQLAPELRPAVEQAKRHQAEYLKSRAEFLDRFLEPHLQDCTGADVDRFRLSLDILLQRKRRHDAQPMRFYYPRLEPVEFFDRSEFPWLDAIEAGFETIRDECLRALTAEQNLVPYIQYGHDQPVAQWAELNHSPRWSVFHLVKDGAIVADNAARCPGTMALWQNAPAPQQSGRTPVALFSLLKPHTRIPAHVGASNVRLLTHLPLVVPPGCAFRVGNSVREWVPGKAWVFDDTIEHEAWNDSDQLRAIMIFDIWHPRLTPQERRLISALNEGLDAFGGAAGGYDA